tara:strand:+ start:34 stop:309 length:276 start_codon:yes stop_codon:yes gene_type:complete
VKIYNYTGDSLTIGNQEISDTEVYITSDTPVYLGGITINGDADRIILYRDVDGIRIQEVDTSALIWPWVILFNGVGFFIVMVKILQRLKTR